MNIRQAVCVVAFASAVVNFRDGPGGGAQRTAIFSSNDVLALWSAMALCAFAEWSKRCEHGEQSRAPKAARARSRCMPAVPVLGAGHLGSGSSGGAMDRNVEKAAAEVLDDNLVLL